jgi:hypothetical protein
VLAGVDAVLATSDAAGRPYCPTEAAGRLGHSNIIADFADAEHRFPVAVRRGPPLGRRGRIEILVLIGASLFSGSSPATTRASTG